MITGTRRPSSFICPRCYEPDWGSPGLGDSPVALSLAALISSLVWRLSASSSCILANRSSLRSSNTSMNDSISSSARSTLAYSEISTEHRNWNMFDSTVREVGQSEWCAVSIFCIMNRFRFGCLKNRGFGFVFVFCFVLFSALSVSDSEYNEWLLCVNALQRWL